MLPEIHSKNAHINNSFSAPRYVSLYRQNANRFQLKLLRQYLCDEPTPLKPAQENSSQNYKVIVQRDKIGSKQLKKYDTIDQIPAIHKCYEVRTPFKDENQTVDCSMKKLSELISESTLPFLKKYVKKSKMGVAEKLITHKIR